MKAQTPRLLKGSKIEVVSDGTVFTLMKEDPTHPGWDKALTDVFDTETKITATYKAKVLTEDPQDSKNYAKVAFTANRGTLEATSAIWCKSRRIARERKQ